MLDTQPLEISDFSGGFTDFYVNAATNKAKTCDNFIIIKTQEGEGKLLTRQGSEIYNETYYQIPAGSQRIGTLINFEDSLLIHSARKLYYISSGWQTLQGPTSNDLFNSATTVASVVSYSTWNKHLFITDDDLTTKPTKIYKDGSSVLKLRTAGMPALASSPTTTPSGAGAANYLYRFVYYYTYTVGTRIFEDYGKPTQTSALNSVVIDGGGVNRVNIAVIPTLANGATDNYDTTVVKVKIYRTINNGTTFYYVGEVTNGTATYTDNSTDAVILATNILLYTEGGVPDNDTPPLCKVLHITEDTAYYAHIKEGSEVIVNRVRQSVSGDPDSCPASFFVDVEDEIVGLSSVKGTPIVLCKNSVFRIDGFFDELGRGGMTAQRISDRATCISAQSAVQTLDLVFWAGQDGFYATDGFRVFPINLDQRQTYSELVDTATKKLRIQGKYDRTNNRIWWTVQKSLYASAVDNDQCYILDLNWPVSENSSFTTVSSGDPNSDNFTATALEFINEVMIRGDRRGYIFSHNDLLVTDPLIDITTAPVNWSQKTIIFDYTSMATNFGSNFLRKFVPRINLTCKNQTNVSVQIISNNDDNKRTANLKPIRYRGNLTWGDPDVYWGDETTLWNQEGLIENQRRFPAGNLRCSYKQITITNAYVAIVNSDLLGSVTVDNLAKTATLINAATTDWPSNSVEYYISFASDGYVRDYLVTARTNDVLTYSDIGNFSPTGTQEWVLRGYPKGESIYILSYTIHYAYLGKTQQQFATNQTGEVGTGDS